MTRARSGSHGPGSGWLGRARFTAAREQLTEGLGRFARPRHPEKSLAELRHLLDRVKDSEPRPGRPARVQAVNTEQRLGDGGVASLRARYSESEAARAVAREFEVSSATVMRLLGKHGLAVSSRLPSAEVVAEAAKHYESDSRDRHEGT